MCTIINSAIESLVGVTNRKYCARARVPVAAGVEDRTSMRHYIP